MRYSYHRVISTYYMERQLPYIMTKLLIKKNIDLCSHLIIEVGDAVNQSFQQHDEKTLKVKEIHTF